MLILFWDGLQPWIYAFDESGGLSFSCQPDSYRQQSRLQGFKPDRVVIAVDSTDLQLLSIDAVGSINRADLSKHKQQCLLSSLGEKMKEQSCLSLGAVELDDGLSRHWVASFDTNVVIDWWEWLHKSTGRRPQVVIPILQLRSIVNGLCVQLQEDQVILHVDNRRVIALIYWRGQLCYYRKFSLQEVNFNVFLQQWRHFQIGKEVEMPQHLLVVKTGSANFDAYSVISAWAGLAEVVVSDLSWKHCSFLVTAAREALV